MIKQDQKPDFLELTNHILSEQGHKYKAKSIRAKAAGQSHENTIMSLTDGSDIVLRWFAPEATKIDNYFGGPRSVFREAEILDIARKQAGIPAAEVLYVGDRGKEGRSLIVKRLSGIHFRDYLEKNDYSLESFLTGLEEFGKAIAKAHSVKFDTYGSIQPEGIIPGTKTYSDYLEKIINRHFDNDPSLQLLNKYFSEKNMQEINDYFQGIINYAKKDLNEEKTKPSFILYDQHSRNFFVDEKTAEPTGFFDLEFGQSAHPNLEFGAVGLQLFGFFSENYVEPARNSFLKGYYESGGTEIINNTKLETVHAANHLISAVKSYDKRTGVRAGWSKEFANMILDIARTGKLNCYYSFTDLIRPVTKQPEHPSRK